MPAPLPLPPIPPPRAELTLSSGSRWGSWVSFVVHLVLLLVIVEITRGDNLWNEVTPATGLAKGGGGGNRVATITLPAYSPPRPVSVRPPVVVPKTIPPVRITRPDPEPKPTPMVDSTPKPKEAGAETGSGGGTGGGAGTGTGPGSGSGTGPGTGSVAGEDSSRGRARPPESTRLILPPFDYPAAMRGQTIDVNFFVLADGRVERVVFIPDVGDRGYARKLEDAMRAYRFRPARDASGLAIRGIAIVRLSF